MVCVKWRRLQKYIIEATSLVVVFGDLHSKQLESVGDPLLYVGYRYSTYKVWISYGLYKL